MNETLSKYLAIGLLLGLIAGLVGYVLSNQVLMIEAGTIGGVLVGAAAGYLLSKKN